MRHTPKSLLVPQAPASRWLVSFFEQFEFCSLVIPCEQPDPARRCLLVEPWRWCCLSSQDDDFAQLHWQALIDHSIETLLLPNNIKLKQSLRIFCRANGISVFSLNETFTVVSDCAEALIKPSDLSVVVQHGVCLGVDGVGVLLVGAAGVGKSEVALAMLRQGAKLVADDAPLVSKTELGALRVSCPELLKGFLAVRDLGVLQVSHLFGEQAVLDQLNLQLVVRMLLPSEPATVEINPLRGSWGVASFCDVPLPVLELRRSDVGNIAFKVQIAVEQMKLLSGGVDSVTEFRLRSDEAMDSAD